MGTIALKMGDTICTILLYLGRGCEKITNQGLHAWVYTQVQGMGMGMGMSMGTGMDGSGRGLRGVEECVKVVF